MPYVLVGVAVLVSGFFLKTLWPKRSSLITLLTGIVISICIGLVFVLKG